MKNALDIQMGGLKCDNPKCDYVDMSISYTDYKNWINAKCPKCGEILLTEEDYKNSLFLLGVAKLANKIFPKREDSDKDVVMTVNTDGSGDMSIDISE